MASLKKLVQLGVIFSLVLTLSGLALGAEYTFKLANVMPAGDHVAQACDKFA